MIIAAAGKAAHLAGVIAGSYHPTGHRHSDQVLYTGRTGCPAGNLVQMPTGIPVATVAIDGAANAAILAVQMLALSDDALAEQLVQRKKTMAEGVVEKEKKLLAQLEA